MVRWRVDDGPLMANGNEGDDGRDELKIKDQENSSQAFEIHYLSLCLCPSVHSPVNNDETPADTHTHTNQHRHRHAMQGGNKQLQQV